jgi:hypothetical protein
MMSCVLWDMKVIRRTKLNTYRTTIKNTVLYISGASIISIQEAINYSKSTEFLKTVDKSTKTKTGITEL